MLLIGHAGSYNWCMTKALIFDFAGVIGVDAYWVWLEENVSDLALQRDYFQAIADQVDRAEITRPMPG